MALANSLIVDAPFTFGGSSKSALHISINQLSINQWITENTNAHIPAHLCIT